MTKPDGPETDRSEKRARADENTQVERVDPKLLELLVCPLTKTVLRYDAEKRELISEAAHVAYPIRKGIPLMTPDAARPLDDDA